MRRLAYLLLAQGGGFLGQLCPNVARGLIAIHQRHVAIHQDDVVRLSLIARQLPGVDAFLTVHGHADSVACILEHATHHLDVELVVLNHKNATRMAPTKLRPVRQLCGGALLCLLVLVSLHLACARPTREHLGRGLRVRARVRGEGER
mgnify:CR=1 FL=1